MLNINWVKGKPERLTTIDDPNHDLYLVMFLYAPQAMAGETDPRAMEIGLPIDPNAEPMLASLVWGMTVIVWFANDWYLATGEPVDKENFDYIEYHAVIKQTDLPVMTNLLDMGNTQ